MAAFALTCVVYLICVGRGARLEAFVLMLECVLVTLVCSFGAYGFLGTGSVVPVLLAVVCGVLIWALDRFVGQKLVRAMEGRSGQWPLRALYWPPRWSSISCWRSISPARCS